MHQISLSQRETKNEMEVVKKGMETNMDGLKKGVEAKMNGLEVVGPLNCHLLPLHFHLYFHIITFTPPPFHYIYLTIIIIGLHLCLSKLY